MATPKLNANDDNTWSVSAETELEALAFVVGLNNCLEHPDLDTPEKIVDWIAQQQTSSEESESDE